MADLEANVHTEGFNFIPKEIKSNMIKVIEHGTEVQITSKDFLKRYNAFGMIKINEEEFNYLENNNVSNLTHFNLQISSHKKKENYLFVKLLKNDMIDISNPHLFECVHCDENVTYSDLNNKEIFDNSFPNIKSIKDLKKVILERYSKKMNYLTSEEILELGISITKLKRVELKEIIN